MKKNWIKWVLDIAMAVVIVLLFNKNATGMAFHEIAGLALFAAFATHLILNAKWIGSMTRRFFTKLPARTRLIYLINLLLVISWVVVAVTGVMISKVVFSFHAGGMAAKSIHSCAAAIGLILFGVHLGLHRQFLGSMAGRLVKLPRRAAVAIGAVLTAVLLVFGCYSMTTTQFTSWLTGPFTAGTMEAGGMSGEKPDFAMESGAQAQGTAASDVQTQGTAASDTQTGTGTEAANQQAMQMHHAEGGQGTSVSSILGTIASYFSIAFLFAFITGVIDHFAAGRKKKQNQ